MSKSQSRKSHNKPRRIKLKKSMRYKRKNRTPFWNQQNKQQTTPRTTRIKTWREAEEQTEPSPAQNCIGGSDATVSPAEGSIGKADSCNTRSTVNTIWRCWYALHPVHVRVKHVCEKEACVLSLNLSVCMCTSKHL